MKKIVKAAEAGHNGLHQFGFIRFVRVTLECGHQLRLESQTEGRRRRKYAAEFVGGERRCPHCPPEPEARGKNGLPVLSLRPDSS